jgi:glucose-6-phosphate 1-dehydrogenase
MIDRLTIFGATGDLTARYLLPGLAALYADGHISDDFELTCASREDWTNDQFHSWATNQLDRHASSLPHTARQAVAASARYRKVDVADADDVAAAVAGEGLPLSTLPFRLRCSRLW